MTASALEFSKDMKSVASCNGAALGLQSSYLFYPLNFLENGGTETEARMAKRMVDVYTRAEEAGRAGSHHWVVRPLLALYSVLGI